MTESLLQLAIEWSTIHVGLVRNIFSLDYDLYGDLFPRSWIKNICNFAHDYRISIPTSSTQIDLHRKGYLFIMEKFFHSGFMSIKLGNMNQ